METNNIDNNNGFFFRTGRMETLSIGDFFLRTIDGYKLVFLGFTPDGKFSYMRTDNKRKYTSRRNDLVFIMDIDGDCFIRDGKIFVNYSKGQRCAISL